MPSGQVVERLSAYLTNEEMKRCSPMQLCCTALLLAVDGLMQDALHLWGKEMSILHIRAWALLRDLGDSRDLLRIISQKSTNHVSFLA